MVDDIFKLVDEAIQNNFMCPSSSSLHDCLSSQATILPNFFLPHPHNKQSFILQKHHSLLSFFTSFSIFLSSYLNTLLLPPDPSKLTHPQNSISIVGFSTMRKAQRNLRKVNFRIYRKRKERG